MTAELPLARARRPDPWAWASVAPALFLWLRTRGAPRGEPFAEDFDFLRRAFDPGISLLDGGGSLAFWRPVSHQLYYETLGGLILSHPGWVAALHAALLALASLLLYRWLRPLWGGPSAAAAAAFPLLAESTRTLVCWPSHFVDLGAFLFLAVALHEAGRDRPWTSWSALLAALWSKELALVGALLLPFLPGRERSTGPRRTLWLAGTGAVIALWALAYAWVRARAGLELPHGLERDPALLGTPLGTRLAWALWNSLRATFSLSLTPGPADPFAAAIGVGFLVAAAGLLAASPERRRALAAMRGWIAWGAAWTLLSWAALASIFPLWAPNRSQLGSVGLGIAAVALARAAHPWLAVGLIAGRAVLFALGPATPATITPEPDARGAFMDYTRLVRLQKVMAATRSRLAERIPDPSPGATFGWHNLPLSTEYAFGGPHAVQSWYRDTTLRWVGFEAFRERPDQLVEPLISYQAPPHREIVLIDPDALRAQLLGLDHLRAGRWSEALVTLGRADSLQRDRAAAVFLGDCAGRRSYCLAHLSRWPEAEREARLALAAAREDVGARFVMAGVHAFSRRWPEAMAELDTVLATAPDHEEALALREGLLAGPLRGSGGGAGR